MNDLRLQLPAAGRAERELFDAMFQGFGGFGNQPELMKRWLAHIGRRNLRSATVDGRLIGGLGIFWFKQCFGGRALDSAGVSAVTVLPEARGAGNAAAMMRQFVRDLRKQGCPLSVLHPSTYGLYRKAGYEAAGSRIEYEIDLAALGVRGQHGRMRRLTERDRSAVARLHRERALSGSGLIERGPQSWDQLLHFGIDPRYAYVVKRSAGRGIDGYLIYTQVGAPREPYELRIRDACAATPDATRAILSFLASHVMIAKRAVMDTGPAEPLLVAAAEDYSKVTHREAWMLRIVDLPKALEGRGYPSGLTAQVRLQVTDDVCPENAGGWLLQVQAGRGRILKDKAKGKDADAGIRGRRASAETRSARSRARGRGVQTPGVRPGEAGGSVAIDIRGLAALYSGHLSAAQLQTIGLADGPTVALADATAIFAGPAPWMNDRF